MSLSLGYGLITAQRSDGAPWEEVYDDALHLARYAEQSGFDSAWVSEHHLADDGYLPSVIPFLAALAAGTQRMTLGTNIAIAPLYHPLRLAEDVAVVATIARRRILLGLGLGYREAEYQAFGTTTGERVARLAEVAEVCRAAWSGDRLTVRRPRLVVVDAPVRPRPAVTPELWMGGTADPALRRVGRLADGYVASSASVEELGRRLAEAEQAGAEHGRAGRLGLVSHHLVSVTTSGVMDQRVAEGIAHMMRTYAAWMPGGPTTPISASRLAMSPEQLSVHGTPDEVVAQLAPYVSAFAGQREHHLMVRLHYPGMSRAATERHVDLFASEVAPRLRGIAAAVD